MAPEVNRPSVLREATVAFDAYEEAMDTYDAEAVNGLFWNSPYTLRYGPNGALIGHSAIAEFRRARKPTGHKRQLRNTLITTFGTDVAVANTEVLIGDEVHYQSQTWVRLDGGWRIVSAHVSNGRFK
jgi:hypothetical protein